ncbi:hypothetical protein FoTM2_007763 [Fusarium oxysporum f. sp. vasinfectum]|nr:hypothetical protein FoTM2_007763 [Fusarium oxysporum f. sp. vasinfectum]
MKLTKRLGAFWALNLSLLPSVLASSSCSQLSGSIYTGPNSNKFDILCDTSTVSGHIFAYYSQGDEFQDCVDRCDGDSTCIVALYLDGSGDCALIDNYQGTRSLSGNDIAIKGAVESSTSASSEATSTEATTSEAPTSEAPTSEAPTSEAPTSEAPTSEAPTSEAPTSEAPTSEAPTSEAPTSEAPTSEAPTSEAPTSEAPTSEAATSSEAATTSETATTEATSTEATSSDTLTISTTSETPSMFSVSSSSISSEDTASGLSSTSVPLSASTALSTTSQPSSSSESTSETSTSAESTTATTATTDSFSTSTSSVETSTDDCDDETSSLETLATVTTSTVTGSEIQPTTLSTNSQSSSITTNQPSDVSTSASSATSTISSPSSLTTTHSQASLSTSLPISVTSEGGSSLPGSSTTTVTQTYTTYSQVASSSGSLSSETTEVGSKTLSTSGATIIKTTSDSHLPTSYPTTGSVWTVYLTLVKYVTCTTGVVAETVTTATYVTVDRNGGSYGPPVITTPAGCIGGYQVDASGHSYPVAQSTPGSPGNSQSSYETGHLHVPTPAAESHGNSQPEQGNKQPSVPESTQGSQANYPDNKNSQPSVPGQGSPEPNNREPQPTGGHTTQTAMPAYHTGTLVNPPLSSPIHQGQQGISTTFTTEASVTEKIQAPKSTHSLSSSEAGDALSTPVSISGANRHRCMALTLVAGALLGLGMLF